MKINFEEMIEKANTNEELDYIYKLTKVDDELVQVAPRIYEYENEKYRRQITTRRETLGSREEQLAVFLHSKLCHYNHVEECGWSYEIKNGVHNWNGCDHKRYLEKAKKMLEITEDIELIKAIIEAAR